MIKENRNELYKYIWGILENKKCHLFRIGGIENHIHIVTHIHPDIPLSGLIKDIKVSSSKYIKEKNLFEDFEGWQIGYGAFTYSAKEKDTLINYVKNQEQHHKKITYKDELIETLKEQGVEYDDKYLL